MSNRPPEDFKIRDAQEQLVRELPALDRHPGVFARDVLLPEYGLNISDVARLLKLNRANLSEVFSGKREVSRDLAYRLGALLRDEVADLLIAYQHAWDLERERDRRDQFRNEIERLAVPDGAERGG